MHDIRTYVPTMHYNAESIQMSVMILCSCHSYYNCYHPETWFWPQITGSPPAPCQGCTLTKVDSYRSVLFGGNQFHIYGNHLYILDMKHWVIFITVCYCFTLHSFRPCRPGYMGKVAWRLMLARA